jgi:hypothetical protein
MRLATLNYTPQRLLPSELSCTKINEHTKIIIVIVIIIIITIITIIITIIIILEKQVLM